jgi:hypothetical protein
MKSIKTLVLLTIVTISSVSCTKEALMDVANQVDVVVGFQVAGQPIELSLNAGTILNAYYDRKAYDNYVYSNGSTTANQAITGVYINSKPTNSESIAVFDKNGNQIGVVRCDQGVGSQTNVLFNSLRSWFDTHTGSCKVQIKWDPIPFTRGGLWSGTIVG